MKFKCPLILVKDIEKSKDFYQTVLNQKIKFDFGENVLFDGDFSVHEKFHYADLVGINHEDIKEDSNNVELYFEEENFDELIDRLEFYTDLVFIHGCIEHAWGQRAIRFYDPDKHIIEVGESMECVVRRFLSHGMSIEQVAEKTQHPIDFVLLCYEDEQER